MAPKYKLIYFNTRGRAEPIRLLFAMAGVPYEDFRFEKEDFAKYKNVMPNGQVPVLEIDGKTTLCQSKAIMRYLAQEFGLRAENPLDRAREDMIVDCLDDLLTSAIAAYRITDGAKKKEALREFEEKLMPTQMNNFNKILEETEKNHGQDFLTKKKITWVDLSFAAYMTGIAHTFNLNCPWKSYSKIKMLIDRVEAEPKIAEWIKKRPVTNQ